MMKKTDNTYNTRFYADCYTWAALVLSHPNESFTMEEALLGLEELAEEAAGEVDLAQEIEALRRHYEHQRFDLLELQKEHSYLFIGPFSLPAPPYESYYRHGRVMQGESSHRVEVFYRETGMEIAAHFKDAPDHLVLETEFMAGLCVLETEAEAAGDLARAEDMRSRQRVFLAAHLTQWVGAFRQAVEENCPGTILPGSRARVGKNCLQTPE